MRHILRFMLISALCFSVTALSLAAEKGQKKSGGKGLKSMSQEAQIKLAMSAAPASISKDASVMLPGDDGKLVEVKKGTNGFTCIPTVNNRPGEPDPMCFDAAVGQWVDALMNNAPKP